MSSYVHQIKRPATNVGNYHTTSKGTTADNSTNQQSVLAYHSATPDQTSHKVSIKIIFKRQNMRLVNPFLFFVCRMAS